jgi:hypothetical protein
MVAGKMWRWASVGALLLILGQGGAARAAAPPTATLLEWIEGRDDLPKKTRERWKKAIRLRFGGAAMNEDIPERPEIGVAKAILASAIFMDAPERKAVDAAWEGWRGALGYVPPPIAVHYQLLTLQGRQPRGRPIDLAFKFPEYYNEEIAPELVAYWERALDDGKIPDDALLETQEALQATRVKMRPLLLDKLRLMARLERERGVAGPARKAEIQRDREELEAELGRSFAKVARRAAVLDAKRAPYDRLLIQLEDMGLSPEAEDRLLDPRAGPPPPIEVPKAAEPEVPKAVDGTPLAEPQGPPPVVLPPQARPGAKVAPDDPVRGRSPLELAQAYARRLKDAVTDWLGTPYRWGNDTPKVGTDCSGFVRRLFAEVFRMPLPRVSRDQFRVGESVPRDALEPGDLVFFDTADCGRVNHVGVYVGGGQFAHAASSTGVVYAKLDERYYARAYRGARRILTYPQ